MQQSLVQHLKLKHYSEALSLADQSQGAAYRFGMSPGPMIPYYETSLLAEVSPAHPCDARLTQDFGRQGVES